MASTSKQLSIRERLRYPRSDTETDWSTDDEAFIIENLTEEEKSPVRPDGRISVAENQET